MTWRNVAGQGSQGIVEEEKLRGFFFFLEGEGLLSKIKMVSHSQDSNKGN